MKSAIVAAAFASVATASPLAGRQPGPNTASGWGAALNGDAEACADVAVIFARGTFDPGNIGPWVGAPFRDAMNAKFDSVAFQGVDSAHYPANLAGYVVEGGSNECAESMGVAVDGYAESCPDSKIVVSGWSQGALCARKSFGAMNSTENVAAFVTFGDPYSVWSDSVEFPAVPEKTAQINLCKSAPTDMLCGDVHEDMPDTPSGVINLIGDIWDSVDEAKMNDEQRAAHRNMKSQLPKQMIDNIDIMAQDIVDGHLARWILSPQHFWYGMDGSVNVAADEIAKVVN